jgi:predicted MFS family arabinose efflux permease
MGKSLPPVSIDPVPPLFSAAACQFHIAVKLSFRVARIFLTSLMNAGTMFAWWGLFTWIPAYLGLPAEKGGMGLDVVKMSTWIIVMQTGMWLGDVSFGFICDRVWRKKTYISYLLAAAAFVVLYSEARNELMLLLLGPFLAFFGTGYFSGFGTITAEIFPTHVRASAQGFTYNIGRGLFSLFRLHRLRPSRNNGQIP